MMELAKEILKRLEQKFPSAEDEIELIDERGDSRHFLLNIRSDIFADLNKVKRSQHVYAILKDLMKDDHIHALRLNLKTHSE